MVAGEREKAASCSTSNQETLLHRERNWRVGVVVGCVLRLYFAFLRKFFLFLLTKNRQVLLFGEKEIYSF